MQADKITIEQRDFQSRSCRFTRRIRWSNFRFMGRSVWIPLLAGISFQILAVLITLLLPETRPSKTTEQSRDGRVSSEEHSERVHISKGLAQVREIVTPGSRSERCSSDLDLFRDNNW